jgi:peptidoglycan hydrolase-like protein with peptidoglycan-binding domain
VNKSKLLVLAIFAVACSSLADTPAKPRKHRRVPATASATPVKRSKVGARRKTTVARLPARSFQQAPTADRYREIQQALASKGYLQSEPNGQWGQESSEALKRFQSEQSLMPDGKINSLSLIALGLGPKRLTAKSDAVPAAPSNPQ